MATNSMPARTPTTYPPTPQHKAHPRRLSIRQTCPGFHLLFQQLPQHIQVCLLFLGHLEKEVFSGGDFGFFGETAVQVQGLGFQHHGDIQGAQQGLHVGPVFLDKICPSYSRLP